MIEVRSQFLLDQFFEDADVFCLQNIDCDDISPVTSKQKTVDGERGLGHLLRVTPLCHVTLTGCGLVRGALNEVG